MDLSGKAAIVTGSSRGIGARTAVKLAEIGADVTINYVSSSVGAEKVRRAIEALGRKCLVVQADVSKKEDVGRLFEKHMQKFQKLDILVNNAGILVKKQLSELNEHEWDQTIRINLKSIFLATKKAQEIMARQKSGKIINLASTAGINGGTTGPHYAASKGAIIAFTKSAAKELAPYKINVNAVAPGPTATDLILSLGKDVQKNYEESIPLGRLGDPSDIANMIAFLASSEADFITGQVFVVDGGRIIT